MASAVARRDATKSAATTGPAPRHLSVAIADRPIAPHPITSGTSPAASAARDAADQPPEIASATHTTSLGRSEATTRVMASVSRKYSPNPPGDSGFWPMILRPPAVASTGRELTRVPTGIRRSVPGP